MITAEIKLVTILLITIASNTQAQSWDIDYAHSSVNFSVNHYFTPITGRFQKFKGSLLFNPQNLSTSSVIFSAEVAAVNTGDAKRDHHLLTEDFFDVNKFPLISFASRYLVREDENSFTAQGVLTIRDIAKEIEIPFKVLGRKAHPAKKGTELMALKAEFLLSRNDYGVGSGSWRAIAVVGDEVLVTIILEATKKMD